MYSAEANNLFINKTQPTKTNHEPSQKNTLSNKEFHNKLQNNIENNPLEKIEIPKDTKVKSFEKQENVITPIETPKENLNASSVKQPEKISDPIPVKEINKVITQLIQTLNTKSPDLKKELLDIINELNALLAKAEDNPELTGEEVTNELLALLNELFQTIPEKPLIKIGNIDANKLNIKTREIELTNPRTKEQLPITLITKEDFAKFTKNIQESEITKNPINIKDIKLKIAALMEELNGTINSSKKTTQIISKTFAINLNKNTKNVKISKEENATELTIQNTNNKETSSKDKTINNKNDLSLHEKSNVKSLFNQNEGSEAKTETIKPFSLSNDLSEYNTKQSIKEVKEPPMLSNMNQNQNNIDKQNKIMNQFRTFLTINKLKADTEVTMKLYPKDLGEVKIQITKEAVSNSEHTQLIAKFQVSSQAVKAILESNFDSLKNDLQHNSNTLIATLSVDINNSDSNNQDFDKHLYKRNQNKQAQTKTNATDNSIDSPEQIIDKDEINSLA